MNTLKGVSVPDSLMQYVSELAKRQGITADQFVASAIAEKVSAFDGLDCLKERAKRGSREKFRRALSKVPNVEPAEEDKFEQTKRCSA